MKLLPLTYQDALENYPEHVARAMKAVSRKFRRASQDIPAPEEMDWGIAWAAGVPNARPPLGEVSAALICRHDQRTTEIPFPEATRHRDDSGHLPHHVLAYYKGSVDPNLIPHAATFRIRNPDGSVDTAIATGGYSFKGNIAVHYLVVGDPWIEGLNDEELIEIQGNRAMFEGGLRDLARKRYDAAGEGGEFTFGSKTMRRMRLDEIRSHVQGKTFTWSLF